MYDTDQYEIMAKALEESGSYRVLRRIDASRRFSEAPVGPVRKGIFIDLETTGLDLEQSEPIEIGMVPFKYTISGQMAEAGPGFQQLNQPRNAIPKRVTEITGLTDELVNGHHFDVNLIADFVSDASIVVAHNAAFDRPFAEKISPVFRDKPWACSMTDVPWHAHGIEGRRLSDLLMRFGLFFDAHRAKDDCEAGVTLLSMILPRSEATVLASLLSAARKSTFRVFAEDSPFELKEILKQRGYRWNTNPRFGPRSWWLDVTQDELSKEQHFLETDVYSQRGKPYIIELTAYSRFRSELP